MARGPFASGENRLTLTNAGEFTYPLSLSVWIKRGNANGGWRFWPISLMGDTGGGVSLSTVSGSLQAVTSASALEGDREASVAGVSSSTWHHAFGRFDSSSHRVAYLDGVAGAPQTSNRSSEVFKHIGLGKRYPVAGWSGAEEAAQGLIAEAAIWNASLSDGEIQALAKGFSARLIRPASLIFYHPLVRGDQGLTVSGLVPFAPHPRRIY